MATYRLHANGAFRLQERPIYGSSRVGLYAAKVDLYPAGQIVPLPQVIPVFDGLLRYELNDHLGNVGTVVTGRLLPGQGAPHEAEVISAQGYEPFGSLLPGRNYSSDAYRFGFNGMEKDDEMHGSTGTSYEFTFRVYDPRAGRFLSVDPIAKNYPHNSPYAFAENSPIQCIDLEGLEKYKVTGRSFIPMATVPNPNPFGKSSSFAGDDRMSYQVNSSAYRTQQVVNVDFDTRSVSYSSNRASSTHGLDKAGKVVETSEAGSAGPVPTFDKAFLTSGNSVTIHMSVDASNKLVTGAPAINYQFDVTITHNDNGTFDYSISGATDGFPAYEFWITDETNNQNYLIFNYTPTETGDKPTALFPPMEYKYNLSGNSASETPATEVGFDERTNSPR